MWKIVYTKQAQKDAKKLSSAGLRSKTEKLLKILQENPYQKPPPCEKLVGDLAGAFVSMRHFPRPLHPVSPDGRMWEDLYLALVLFFYKTKKTL